MDCGGRLGPYKNEDPDLRNLTPYYAYLKEGDYLIVVSDGVHDNFDPQELGISPKHFGLDTEDWNKFKDDEEKLKEIVKIKSEFSCNLIRDVIVGNYEGDGFDINTFIDKGKKKENDISCELITKRVIDYCFLTTKKK